MSQDVYRASKLPAPIEAPPRELVYVATNHEKQGIHFAWMQLFVLPVILGIVVAVFHPWLGLAVMLGAFAYGYRFRKTSVTGQGAILRIAEGELRVFSRQSSRVPMATIKLRDLADVKLDIKTIQRVQEGDSMVAAVRFTNTTVGPSVDQARIELVGKKTKDRDRFRLHLTDEYFAHMDSTEWLGKIRVFLRKNDWLPADERKKDEKPAVPPLAEAPIDPEDEDDEDDDNESMA